MSIYAVSQGTSTAYQLGAGIFAHQEELPHQEKLEAFWSVFNFVFSKEKRPPDRISTSDAYQSNSWSHFVLPVFLSLLVMDSSYYDEKTTQHSTMTSHYRQ